MKVYTVNMKKAVAKCNQVDAPELELPPYRSVDRFVNTMLSFARDMESNQFEQLYKMMTFKKMMSNMKNDDSFMSEKMMPYDMMKNQYNNKYGMNDKKMDMNKFEKMFEMISEMKSQKQQYDAPVAAMRSSMNFDMPDFEKMANFMANFRSKRAADTDSLALNDRLKEKIQHVFKQQQSKVGNMTCVLREMNCLNAENEIDVRAMKKDAEQYNMPSEWFKNRYEEIIDTCHEVANTLPEKLYKQEIVKGDFGTVNMGQIKSFMGCCKNAKQRLCMKQDIKNKIETNFGPVEQILESFKYQMTEDQLFRQVYQLLHGEGEDEYM